MKPFTRHQLTFFLLAILFIAPGLSAYVVYLHPQWLTQSTTNKGHLLNSPHKLTALNNEPFWRIILWSPDGLDDASMKQLEQLARVRIALGRHFYDVQLCLLQRNDAPSLPLHIKKALHDHGIHYISLSEKEITQAALPPSAMVFLANPMKHMVLEYNITSEPNDIFHDLNILLNLNKTSKS